MNTTLQSPPKTTAAKKLPTVGENKKFEPLRASEIEIKKILVPLDFSRAAMQAFDYATTLAKQFDAQIELVHVQLPDEACAVPGAGHLIRECAEAATFVHKRLGQLKPERPPQFWPENCHLRTGNAYEEICKLASKLNADLIVLGSRGNTGLKRIVLGSTAERVVRFAPCPVLVVRKMKGADGAIRKILVPTDFSKCAMAAAIYGARLAKALKAKLELFNVVFPAAPVLIDRVAMNLPIDNTLVMREARLNMQGLRELDLFKDMQCRGVVRSGYVTDTICGEADDVDLVVISTHGRTGLKHAFIGSVAEQVVRYADCPVMVVPSRCAVS